MEEIVITFDSPDRGGWIEVIVENAARLPASGDITLFFQNIKVDDIEPVHLVTLACFIEMLDRRALGVVLGGTSHPLRDFLFETLKIDSYWRGKQNYVPSADVSLFNLWRIVDEEKELHSSRVHDYLQRHFEDKDLSAVKNSLNEVYYNIFDHAQARGNAFSFLKFDQAKRKLHVAVCDFGHGIARTVQEKEPSIVDDADALAKALEDKFTVGSRTYNRGLGLGNIRAACRETDALRILSNGGFLYARNDYVGVRANTFHFPGTLIYYELSLGQFDELEIIPTFEL